MIIAMVLIIPTLLILFLNIIVVEQDIKYNINYYNVILFGNFKPSFLVPGSTVPDLKL